jgi:hypothetical protein
MENFHQEELSLFVTPPADTSLQSREWITYRPVNQVTNASALEFNIPGHTSAYLDLKRSVLNLKLQIVHGDGSAVDPDEVVGPINLPLHTIFGQIDVFFNKRLFRIQESIIPIKRSSTRYYSPTKICKLTY